MSEVLSQGFRLQRRRHLDLEKEKDWPRVTQEV